MGHFGKTGSEFVHGDWQGGFAGVGTVSSGDHLYSISAPSAVGGSGDGVSPLSLLIAAASSCFLLTLVGILQQRGIAAARITIETEGIYRVTAPPELYAIFHRPTVVLKHSQASQRDTIVESFKVAEVSCMATRTMSSVAFTVAGGIVMEELVVETLDKRQEK